MPSENFASIRGGFVRSCRIVKRRWLLPLLLVPPVIVAGPVIAAALPVKALSPRANRVVHSAKRDRPTFKVELTNSPGGKAGTTYAVFLRASLKKTKRGGGLIGKEAYIGQMKQLNAGGRVFQLTPDSARDYTYGTYWLNRTGRSYFWQAYYIYCKQGQGCIHPGPVRRIHIRR